MFALVDCDSFYCSCEKVFRPDLRNQPVVVASNNDGCVIARSREAKEAGVQMGEPLFKRMDFLRKCGIHVFSSNYPLYGDMSRRMMEVLSSLVPKTEVYSIDEAFLDLGNHRDFTEQGLRIRQKTFKHTGLSVSVGIGRTKTLAKTAGFFAKGANSRVYMLTARNEPAHLKKMPVSKVWGIGRRLSSFLIDAGIHTAWDLVKTPDHALRHKLRGPGLAVKHELLGRPCSFVDGETAFKKNICTSRSFGKTVTTLAELEEAVATYASLCAAKLRKQGGTTAAVQVFLYSNPFQIHRTGQGRGAVVCLPRHTNSTFNLVKYALAGLRGIFREGFHYKKAGVILLDISEQSKEQLDIFNTLPQYPKVDRAMDAINKKYGAGSIFVAAEGTRKDWWMNQRHKSPCYTTRWNDIITVNSG